MPPPDRSMSNSTRDRLGVPAHRPHNLQGNGLGTPNFPLPYLPPLQGLGGLPLSPLPPPITAFGAAPRNQDQRSNALSHGPQNRTWPAGHGHRLGDTQLAPYSTPLSDHIGDSQDTASRPYGIGTRPGDRHETPIDVDTLPPNAFSDPQRLPAPTHGHLRGPDDMHASQLGPLNALQNPPADANPRSNGIGVPPTRQRPVPRTLQRNGPGQNRVSSPVIYQPASS
jgi:hypothetical protein